MKHSLSKFLALLLGLAILTALLPAASAAKPDDLRYVVANQAKAIADIDWKLETRLKSNEYPDHKRAAFFNLGVRPTYYYEYIRMQMAYKGAIFSEYSASYEQIVAQTDENGYLPVTPNFDYYGMNADAFLVDVVSRVSPTPITGVKQAIQSGALTPLVAGVNPSAASSQLAVSDTKALNSAYGKLSAGDLLISWDDNANTGKTPIRHVMVVTLVEVNGSVHVTYPAYTAAFHHFTCATCGAKSVEGPTGDPAPKHVVSKNYAFAGYATHAAVAPSSGCSGTFRPDYSTTWRTKVVSRDELSGATSFSEGGVCYIPYTLPVYTTGAPELNVKLDTTTTSDTLAAGFEGTITSNYRITQVDAILSTTGAPDQVFTQYPSYDAWTYHFKDDALDRALVSSSAGNCSLTLNVHSGPILDSNSMKVPVTKVFSASTYLSEPSFELFSDTKVVHQGHPVCVSIRPTETDITAVKMELTYDRDTYSFDLTKTRSANKNLTVAENADGSVSIAYSGAAVTKGESMADLYFVPYRTGAMPIPAEQTGIFAVRTAWKGTVNHPDLLPARFGGDPVAFGIGYNLKVFENYAAGKSLILLGAEGGPVKATYGEQTMPDVGSARYKLDGNVFTHHYAIVVDSVDLDLFKAEPLESTSLNTVPFLLDYDRDVNRSGSVDVSDAQAVANIIAGRMPLEGNLEKWLVADVDANGVLNTADIRTILSAANK